MSISLTAMQSISPLFKIAFVTATENANNLAGLNCSGTCRAAELRFVCSPDPLAVSLTSQGWPDVFGQDNDAVVPLSSQLNSTTLRPQTLIIGAIHSAGMKALNFNGPTELESQSGIPDVIVNLLNEPLNGGDFQ